MKHYTVCIIWWLTMSDVVHICITRDVNVCQQQVDTKLSLVWGPGLIADMTLPARYFYIQAVDTCGNK